MALNDFTVVTSSSEDDYLEFWPLMSASYKHFFGVESELAILTERNIINKWHAFPPVDGVPIPNLAKVLRFILASQMEDTVCMISDIDIIPLQSEHVLSLLEKRKPGQMLTCGYDMFRKTYHDGRFQIRFMTAEGYVFKEILNPKNLGYEDLIRSLCGMHTIWKYEDIAGKMFSDELMWRALISKWDHKDSRIVKIEGCSDVSLAPDLLGKSSRVLVPDRSKQYIYAHLHHPLSNEMNAEIIKYIGEFSWQ